MSAKLSGRLSWSRPAGEEHAGRGIEFAAAWDKYVDEVAGGAVKAQDVLAAAAVDIEIAIGTKLEYRWVAQSTRRLGNEGIDESARRAIVTHDPADDMAADIEISVRSKEKITGVHQVAALGKHINKFSGLAVKAADIIGAGAVDIKVAIGAEIQAFAGPAEAAAAGSDEAIDVLSRLTIEALDAVIGVAADVEVAIGAEDDAGGFGQVATLGKDVDKLAAGAVKSQDIIGAVAGDVEIAVRADGKSAGVNQAAAGSEDALVVASLLIVAEDLRGSVTGDEKAEADPALQNLEGQCRFWAPARAQRRTLEKLARYIQDCHG